jgi:hypothetical protein
MIFLWLLLDTERYEFRVPAEKLARVQKFFTEALARARAAIVSPRAKLRA